MLKESLEWQSMYFNGQMNVLLKTTKWRSRTMRALLDPESSNKAKTWDPSGYYGEIVVTVALR